MILFIVLGSFGKKKKPVKHLPLSDEGEESFAAPEDLITEKIRALIGDYNPQESASAVVKPAEDTTDREKVVTKPAFEIDSRSFEDYRPVPEYFDKPLDQIYSINGEIQEGVSSFENYDSNKYSDLSEDDIMESDILSSSDLTKKIIDEEIYTEMDLRKAIIYSEVINRKYI